MRIKAKSDLVQMNENSGAREIEDRRSIGLTERCMNADGDRSKPGTLDRPWVCMAVVVVSVGVAEQHSKYQQQQKPKLGSRKEPGVCHVQWGLVQFFTPRGNCGCSGGARAVLRSLSCFSVYVLCGGFLFLSTFPPLLNSVPVLCLSLPASATHALSQAVTFFSSTACAFLKSEMRFGV